MKTSNKINWGPKDGDMDRANLLTVQLVYRFIILKSYIEIYKSSSVISAFVIFWICELVFCICCMSLHVFVQSRFNIVTIVTSYIAIHKSSSSLHTHYAIITNLFFFSLRKGMTYLKLHFPWFFRTEVQ